MIHQVIFMQLTSMDANFLPNDTDAGEGQGFLRGLKYFRAGHILMQKKTFQNICPYLFKLAWSV